MDVSRIDLNLLVAFDAAMRHRNVTRAAASLGLSQSALSGAIARLRAIARDPLFVREARGIVPTARAERLAGPIRAALGAVHAALFEEGPFDPATSERTFRIAASDYATLVVLPRLFERVSHAAPRTRLVASALSTHEPPAGLAAGEIDLAVGVFRALPAPYRRRTVARERMACLVRARGARGALRLRAYLKAPHVLASPAGKSRGSVDETLEAMGRSRRVALVVPSWVAAARTVACSDLVLTLPERVARALGPPFGLRIRAAPPEIDTPFAVEAIWHERRHHDPAHAWLREAVYAAAVG